MSLIATASQSSQLVNKNPSTERRAFYILSKHTENINHQCECVVPCWLSKERSLAAPWYWNWQCSCETIFHIHHESEPQTNHMQVLIEQCNLSSRTNQSRTSTSIEHRKSSAYHFAASWWVFAYLASRPLTPENILHTKGDKGMMPAVGDEAWGWCPIGPFSWQTSFWG